VKGSLPLERVLAPRSRPAKVYLGTSCAMTSSTRARPTHTSKIAVRFRGIRHDQVNGSFEMLKLAQIGGGGAFCEGKVRDDIRQKKWSWWAMGSSDPCVWLRSSPSPDRTSGRGLIGLWDE
jgi:hypothetical protein